MTTAPRLIHSPTPSRRASPTRRLSSETSNRPPQGQSRGSAGPASPLKLPPPGEQRSRSGTSRSTRTQIGVHSWRCRLQRMMVVIQLCGPISRPYLRFGVRTSALAAALFSAFVLFGFESTLDAADAAFDPVCLVLRATEGSPLPSGCKRAPREGRLRISAIHGMPLWRAREVLRVNGGPAGRRYLTHGSHENTSLRQNPARESSARRTCG